MKFRFSYRLRRCGAAGAALHGDQGHPCGAGPLRRRRRRARHAPGALACVLSPNRPATTDNFAVIRTKAQLISLSSLLLAPRFSLAGALVARLDANSQHSRKLRGPHRSRLTPGWISRGCQRGRGERSSQRNTTNNAPRCVRVQSVCQWSTRAFDADEADEFLASARTRSEIYEFLC